MAAITASTLKNQLARYKATAMRVREVAAEKAAIGFTAAETAGAAFGMGYVNARFGAQNGGEMRLFGQVPLDAAVGGGLHVLGFLDMLGKNNSAHLHALANGALASYLVRQGAKLGVSGARAPSQMGGAGYAPTWDMPQWAQPQAAE